MCLWQQRCTSSRQGGCGWGCGQQRRGGWDSGGGAGHMTSGEPCNLSNPDTIGAEEGVH